MSNQVESSANDRSLESLFSNGKEADSSEGILRTVWRHKLLMIMVIAIALGVGFWLHRQKPTTYAASTTLMVRSDKPLVLDVDTGNVVGGVPDSQVLETLIRSDKIANVAAADPEIAAVTSASFPAINSRLRAGLNFYAQKTKSRDRAIGTLSCNGSDPDFCVAAVNATARAIEAYFASEQDSSFDTFSALISKAEGKLLPQLQSLEREYREFRATAPLEWSAGGDAVNPHRERQLQLRAQELELEKSRRSLVSDRRVVTSMLEQQKDRNKSDLTLIVELVNQMARGDDLGIVADDHERPIEKPAFDMKIQDLKLEELRVEQSLVPLIVEQQQMIADLGTNHPAVRSLDAQVANTRQKLNELAVERQKRMDELRLESEQSWKAQGFADRAVAALRERQEKFILGYINAVEHRINLLDDQLKEIEESIAEEKRLADALVKAETDDAMYQRQIESIRGMLIELEQHMAGLNVSEVNNGVIVEPLMSAVTPYVTGPNIAQDMVIAALIGLGLGGLLSIMIESSARTFRNSEQIVSTLKTPVIAHIPLDEQATSRKRSRATTREQRELHPNLSVLHRPECSATEAYRCTRTTILFDNANNGNKVYQVTSPLPGDGKSTIAANLACALAQSGKKTLLIDLDLRSPRLTSRFNLEDAPGLTNLLNGECDPRTAIVDTPVRKLDFVPSGVIPSNPAEALLLPELEDAFNWFRDQYDFVIVDTPPLLLVTDPAITTTYVDSTILTFRIVRKCKPNTKEAISILRNAGADVVGIAVNKIDEVGVGSYYQIGGEGSYRSVGYGYGRKYRKDRQKGKDPYEVLGTSERSVPGARDSDVTVEA